MTNAYFITATGTEIGKTFVTSLLLRLAQRDSRSALALKPVISGYDPETPDTSDTAHLLQAMERPVTADAIATLSPWRFTAPLSPHRAAELEGRTLDVEVLTEWCQAQLSATPNSLHLIEGAGGIMAPLTYTATMLDWMRALNLPVILITSDYLGTLSHTLSALHCLRQSGIELAATIINASETPASPDILPATLQSLSPYPEAPIVTLPRFSMEEATLWQNDTLFKQVDSREECTDFLTLAASL